MAYGRRDYEEHETEEKIPDAVAEELLAEEGEDEDLPAIPEVEVEKEWE